MTLSDCKDDAKAYLIDLAQVLGRFDLAQFDRFVAALNEARSRDAAMYIFGNGGSGSTASHFVADINKGASYGKRSRFRMHCLNDNIPLMLAYSNDVSYDVVFAEQVKNHVRQGDLVIGISGSGNSKNVLLAIDEAKRAGARTFGLCGFGGGKLAPLCDDAIIVQSNDMQKVEDAHVIVMHMLLQALCKEQAPV